MLLLLPQFSAPLTPTRLETLHPWPIRLRLPLVVVVVVVVVLSPAVFGVFPPPGLESQGRPAQDLVVVVVVVVVAAVPMVRAAGMEAASLPAEGRSIQGGCGYTGSSPP